jgi:hypothetical protein
VRSTRGARRRPVHAAKRRSGDVRNAVVARQALVQERASAVDEVEDALIFPMMCSTNNSVSRRID